MSAYSLIASFTIEHDYIGQGSDGIQVVPDDSALALARRCNVVIKKTNDGFALFADTAHANELETIATEQPAPVFWFRIHAQDPSVLQSTSSLPSSGSTLLFSGPGVDVARADGALSFAAGAKVTEADEVSLDHDALTPVKTTRDGQVGLLGFLRLSMADLPRPGVAAPLNGVIRFGARTTRWRYIVTGDPIPVGYTVTEHSQSPSGDEAQIGDAVSFVTGEQTLPDGRAAITFTSNKAIEMRRRHHSSRHFVLRNAAGQAVINQLPEPAPGALTHIQDAVDGHEEVVSEIYINLP